MCCSSRQSVLIFDYTAPQAVKYKSLQKIWSRGRTPCVLHVNFPKKAVNFLATSIKVTGFLEILSRYPLFSDNFGDYFKPVVTTEKGASQKSFSKVQSFGTELNYYLNYRILHSDNKHSLYRHDIRYLFESSFVFIHYAKRCK